MFVRLCPHPWEISDPMKKRCAKNQTFKLFSNGPFQPRCLSNHKGFCCLLSSINGSWESSLYVCIYVSVSVLNSLSIHFKRKSYFRHTVLVIFLQQWSGQLCAQDIFSCFMTERVSSINKKNKKVDANEQEMPFNVMNLPVRPVTFYINQQSSKLQ